jgi:cell division protein FtsZ
MSEMGMAMMGTGSARGENRAREAAEAAIRSPLLEDINLQGARGILVNITAGPDLSLGEFSEVGDTVHEFAADNATVVIGTAIDPDMGDEIKVTVVATGLGELRREAAVPTLVRNATLASAQPNYKDFDSPAIRRATTAPRRDVPVPPRAAQMAVGAEPMYEDSQFDIPAFLRRQAD